jgi:hypothetical protein
MKEYEYQIEISTITEKFIVDKVEDALAEVQKIMDGKGCSCPQCTVMAVIRVNDWIDYYMYPLVEDKENYCPDYLHFELVDGEIIKPRWFIGFLDAKEAQNERGR